MHTDTQLDLRGIGRDQRRQIVRALHTDPDLAGLTHVDRAVRCGEWLNIDEVAGDAVQLDEVAELVRGVWPDAAEHLEQLAAEERDLRGGDLFAGVDYAIDEVAFFAAVDR